MAELKPIRRRFSSTYIASVLQTTGAVNSFRPRFIKNRSQLGSPEMKILKLPPTRTHLASGAFGPRQY